MTAVARHDLPSSLTLGTRIITNTGIEVFLVDDKAYQTAFGVACPPTAKHQEAMKELRGLSGAKFDQKYMAQAGVKDHKAALELFQDGAKKADDPQLKSFFEKNLSHIKQHLAMAQEVAQRDGSSSGTSKKQEGSAKK